MYRVRLALDENKSYLNNPNTLADITCSSTEDFERQLRKDAELYVIKDIVLERQNLTYDDDYKQLMKKWNQGVSKWWGVNKLLTIDATGEFVEISHVLTDSRAVYASSPTTTTRILGNVAQKYAELYWSRDTVTEDVNIAPGCTMKPIISYLIVHQKQDVKNKTFSIKRTLKVPKSSTYNPFDYIHSWFDRVPLKDVIRDAFVRIFQDYSEAFPSYTELLTAEDCSHLYRFVNEKYGARGFIEQDILQREVREYLSRAYPTMFKAEGNSALVSMIQRNPTKYFVGPWTVDIRSDYINQLNEMILEKMSTEEFIKESISVVTESENDRLFTLWWHDHVGTNIKDLERHIKRYAGSHKARTELVRDIMNDYLGQKISFAQTVQSLVPYFPQLDSLAQALEEKKFEVFESDAELDAIAYETYRTHILSNPHIHRWFDYYLDEQRLKENEYRLVLNGEFLDGFYDGDEDSFMDDGKMFVSSAHETGFKEWISRHILDLYPSFSILLSSIGPDYTPYHGLMQTDLANYARSEQAFMFLVQNLSYVMSEDDYLDLYEVLILREVESAGLDPRDITLVWDLEG